MSLTEHTEDAEVKACLGLFIIEKDNALFSVNSVSSSEAGERKTLSLTEDTEDTEDTENTNTYKIFFNKIIEMVFVFVLCELCGLERSGREK